MLLAKYSVAARIDGILRRDGLVGMFQVIAGGEDVSVQRPDPTGSLLAAGKLEYSAAETAYVGDSQGMPNRLYLRTSPL